MSRVVFAILFVIIMLVPLLALFASQCHAKDEYCDGLCGNILDPNICRCYKDCVQYGGELFEYEESACLCEIKENITNVWR